jgi:hypothetical protein
LKIGLSLMILLQAAKLPDVVSRVSKGKIEGTSTDVSSPIVVGRSLTHKRTVAPPFQPLNLDKHPSRRTLHNQLQPVSLLL